MNPDLNKLHPYPFEKLNQLKAGVRPNTALTPIALSIGEPKHRAPDFVRETLINNLQTLSNYPKTKGCEALRQAIAEWLKKRFQLRQLDAETQVLPVNGTREALFAFAQAVIDKQQANPLVLSPNPFYQIYEGAALLAGAKPVYLNCSAEQGYLPNYDAIDEQTWRDCQLLFICSPGNPSGAVTPLATLQKLIKLAHKYNFIIASDECYSELYFDETKPPTGLLEACHSLGIDDYRQCVVFHSLSKRSNLPGLRSGFVAGDTQVLKQFLLYRTYHGCAMPEYSQQASIAAWQDEQHVIANRELYREKFHRVLDILSPIMDTKLPDGSFYLWPDIKTCDLDFAQQLFAQQHVTVLPGQLLSRESQGINPGADHIRIALVATLEECLDAAQRIKAFMC